VVGKIKFGKTAVVIFITVLIWVYADLALDEEETVYDAKISVVKSNPRLWVSFDGEPSASIEQVVLKGPRHRLDDVKRMQEKEEGLEFSFDAAREKMDESGNLKLLPFLQEDKEVKRLGLTVEDCKPDRIFVKIVKLVKRQLEVRCVDEDGNVIPATLEPEKVWISAPNDVEYFAQVQLTRGEITQARGAAIFKNPDLRLGEGQQVTAEETVRIRIPEQDPRKDYSVTGRLGIALSPNLQGRYSVEVTNLNEVVGLIAIRATDEAKRAYETQLIPSMTLYIFDEDKNEGTEVQRRDVVYNFPPDFFRNGEIELKNPQQPAQARFRLIPLAPAENGSVGSE
jgi:hypothetical protein